MKRFASFWIYPSLAAVLIIAAKRSEPERLNRDLLWLLAIGVLCWTLLEYLLHRFLFHLRLPFRNPQLQDILNSGHLQHHASPRDPEKVLARPMYALLASTALYGLLYLATRSVLSTAGAMTGIWAGFLYYEAVHYRVHFSLSSSGLIGRRRRAHFYHHFTNNKRCFGVTSPFWDYVFGTAAHRTGPTD